MTIALHALFREIVATATTIRRNASHALLRVRPVQNLLVLDLIVQQREIRGLVVRLAVEIPDLDNTEALLRADRDTHDLVTCVCGACTESRRRQIAIEDLDRIPAADLQAVRPTADIDLVLPQRRDVATHDAQQTIRRLVLSQLAQHGAQSLPAVHHLQLLVAVRSPGLVLWLMIVYGP